MRPQMVFLPLLLPLIAVGGCATHENGLAQQVIEAMTDAGLGQRVGDERLLAQRKIILTSEINAASAHRIIAELMILAHRNATEPIDFYIVSPGGDLDSALAVVSVMRMIAPPVNTHALASCESGAALLLVAGTGRRTATPGSVIGIHGYITHGQVPPRYLHLLVQRYADILRSRTSLPNSWFPIQENEIHVLSARQALKYHVVDAVTHELATRAIINLGQTPSASVQPTPKRPGTITSGSTRRLAHIHTAAADRIADR